MGWPCPSVSSSLPAQNALSLVNSHESVPGQLLLCYDHFPMCTCRWRLTDNLGRHTPIKLGWVASEPQVSAALVLGQCWDYKVMHYAQYFYVDLGAERMALRVQGSFTMAPPLQPKVLIRFSF